LALPLTHTTTTLSIDQSRKADINIVSCLLSSQSTTTPATTQVFIIMTTTVEEPFDIGAKLKQRLETTKVQKDATQTKINALNNELKTLFVKIPKRPRETMTEMDDKINTLEFKRTTNSMDLSDEKLILREIQSIQKMKNVLHAYNAGERQIQEKKGQLTDLRESSKVTSTAILELEAALNKCTLATKLGCTPAELQTVSVDIRSDKIGRVIGKNGATIAQLEATAMVVMDVDSAACKIHLTGSPARLAIAIGELDKISLAQDVSLPVSSELITYLTTKRIRALQHLRDTHSDLQLIDAYRGKNGKTGKDTTNTVSLRGLPDAVANCQADVLTLAASLVSETRVLIGRQSSAILVGKAGSTINRLTEQYQVTIDVTETGDDVFTATVVGLDVTAAMQEIDTLLEDNQNVEESLTVDAIVRNTLLTDAGAPIKALQKKVNAAVKDIGGGVQLSFFNKDETKGNNKSSSSEKKGNYRSPSSSANNILMIKGRRAAVVIAKEMVTAALETIAASLVTITVDPSIVPQIIGKGGETIKKLKKNTTDKKVVINIEVDKVTGRIVIQSQDDVQVQRVQDDIHAIVAKNQVVRIPLAAATGKPMIRELVRSKHQDEINKSVWMGLDNENDAIILRGTREDVDAIAIIVNEFIAENYLQEVEISAEDEPTLLAGGSDSPIQKFQEEYGAELKVIRSRFVIICKGQKEKVEAAVKRLDQFLHGGDGYTVSRVTVTEQALGVVIGKAGSKRAELEKTHEGVHLFIHKSNRITIRGPVDAVEACRIDILRLVSSVKIQQVLKISPEEHAILSKPDTLKRVANGIPVQVTLTQESVKMRGIFADVRDTMGMLREVLTGIYVASVELESSQLSVVRGACRDPSHLQRMKDETNADVKLDLASNSIVISGKRANVKKAKLLVVLFLDFLLPDDFARLEVSRPVQLTIGDASSLADIAAISGATLLLDRDLSAILIQSSDHEKVKKASELLKTRIEDAEKKVFVVTFTATEQWLIPLIIGKGGIQVNSLRLDTGCNIDINKAERSVTVTSEDMAQVGKAKELLEKMIDDARRQVAFVELPQESIAAFVGRNGTHIKAFAAEHTVEVERLRKSPTKLKITGEEESVKAAKVAMQAWIDVWEMKQAGKTIAIDKPSIPVVLGKNGSVIMSLQKEYGCKVEINREELTLTVRGGTEESRDKAIEKINQIVSEDKERHSANKRERTNGSGSDDGDEKQENGTAKTESATAGPAKTEPTKNGTSSNGRPQKPDQAPANFPTMEVKKDRTNEFARRPVGLTIVEKEASKPKKKRNRNKNRHRDISDDSTLQVGSSAGRSLFNLLVSETSANPDHETNHESSAVSKTTGTVSLMVSNEEQWDSSTVSSAAIDSSDPDEHAGGAKPYIKSASGFTVRV